MELRKWMVESGIRTRFFADKLGIHTRTINAVASHLQRPSWALAKKIEEFTKGEVNAIELMEIKYGNDRRI